MLKKTSPSKIWSIYTKYMCVIYVYHLNFCLGSLVLCSDYLFIHIFLL
jgi:hypothetical protein